MRHSADPTTRSRRRCHRRSTAPVNSVRRFAIGTNSTDIVLAVAAYVPFCFANRPVTDPSSSLSPTSPTSLPMVKPNRCSVSMLAQRAPVGDYRKREQQAGFHRPSCHRNQTLRCPQPRHGKHPSPTSGGLRSPLRHCSGKSARDLASAPFNDRREFLLVIVNDFASDGRCRRRSVFHTRRLSIAKRTSSEDERRPSF